MELCIESLGPAECLSPERRLDLSIQLQALRHPVLARQLGLTVEDGELLLFRESVPGISLERLLESAVGPLAPDEILPWLLQVADLGELLHDRGSPWSLAPLEPTQLVVTPEGRLVLVDLRPLQQPCAATLREDLRAVGRLAGRLLARTEAELPAGWRDLLRRLRSERAPMRSFAELKAALAKLQRLPSRPAEPPLRTPGGHPTPLWGALALALLVAVVLLLAAASKPTPRLPSGPLLALARGQRLELRPLGPSAAPRELSLGAPIDALATDPGGNVWVALADGTLLRLDSRRLEPHRVLRLAHRARLLKFGFPTRALAADPETGWVGSLELRDKGWTASWQRRPGFTDLACAADTVYAARGELEAWSWAGETLPSEGAAYRLSLSRDGRELAITTRSGRVELLGKSGERRLLGQAGPAPRALAFGSSRVWVATAGPRLLGFSTKGAAPVAFALSAPARSLAVEPRGLWVTLPHEVVRLDPRTGATEVVLSEPAEALCVRP